MDRMEMNGSADSAGYAQSAEMPVIGENGETLIEQFKRYYENYRMTSGVDSSFQNASEALSASILNLVGQSADNGDLVTIRNLMHEYSEIRLSVQASNDSLKERFELQYKQRYKPSY
ncbi:hypothetical protein Back11_15200 [Paenibacillus baekrokdamisoli]|uniref:Uncharacterized protein n=1 Tax=Paenibacillus baekrokdamisoli TaxID=1712516 RepID=A0A3G9IVM8_9BACL|nr:hypothetical protein [Paenibacillus baekrokdamisoli]MBB3072785.1 hypothetical protein [Paenibacillus baekrokdamisoli]BBH20175.1 hypothetical protein Back11_15200 [Paenibacillus baekrokdamisoli]